MRRARRLLLGILAALVLLILLAAALSAWSNRDLPTASSVVDRLAPDEKARVAEFLHLKQALGDSVWPGWGQAGIPVLLYNETNAFLISYSNPPAGWSLAADERPIGEYYIQPAVHPQAFAVKVGDRWVGSMATMEWTRLSLMNQIRSDLPPFIQPIFPYRLVAPLYYSDWQIAALAHESFHAYQAEIAPDRFAAALASYHAESNYPWGQGVFKASWQEELDVLAKGSHSKEKSDMVTDARRFLGIRTQRRESAQLTPEQIAYEQQIEWLEGLGKYVELTIWRAGDTTKDYSPVPAILAIPDFKRYAGYEDRWNQELDQMRSQASREGDLRFYYTGMAQARMLDRLMPDWKSRIMTPGVTLEGLLREAVIQ
ncbi:MAG: hypothetical protein WCF84_15610 [Anaerolineae bacterium]